MENFNNKLCLTGLELISSPANTDGLFSVNTYSSLVKRGHIKVIRRGCYGTPALIEFDSLPDRYKSLLAPRVDAFRKSAGKNEIADIMQHDPKAAKYYNEHELDNGKTLPEDTIKEYCANAEVLNALHILVMSRRAKIKSISAKLNNVWDLIAKIIADLDTNKYPHTLPVNPVSLKNKYKKYMTDGYASLIHKGFCNKNTEKINDSGKLWLLSKWANHVERVTSEAHLLSLYNHEAGLQNWDTIESPQTIHNFLYSEGIKELWYGHRYGELKSKEKFALQNSTKLPSMRDSLWYSDGTKLNYFYLTEDGKIETTSVYEVMDAYSEVLLGYHISKSENYEAQFASFKMAIQTAGHRPYQVTFDNQGGHKKLDAAQFFEKISHLAIRTAPYNGKSKTIENAFDRFQSGWLKRDWYFTGQNIGSKKLESKANMEFILANVANLPSLEEIKLQYKSRRNDWNNAPHPKTGLTRMETYRNSYNPETPKVEMWDMVDMFWMVRKEPVTCTAYGISFKEKKVKYDYLVYGEDRKPDIAFIRKYVDQKFYVKYDPEDLSLIYLYEGDALGLRFVSAAETKVVTHRGKQEQEDWEAEYYKGIELENKRLRIETRDKMDEILEAHNMLPEQNGLNSPLVKGIEKKKDRKEGEIGKYQKAMSNKVVAGDDDDDNFYNKM